MESEKISSIACTRSVNLAQFLALLHSVKKARHAKGCFKHIFLSKAYNASERESLNVSCLYHPQFQKVYHVGMLVINSDCS